MFSDNSFVKRSGQTWKFWVFLILLFIGFVLILPALTSSRRLDDDIAIVLLLAGLALHIGNMVWLAIAIRCPKCRASLGWHAIRRRDANTWLFWLLQSEKCPACGFCESRS